ncbi:UDP-glucuronosyltransferase 2C1 isoform X2 [Eurytemora carolleeae]|uniref:UDP-glucuronosyltransferase 2C1 isoform X2 n=1 Tax=Eurytemora carolleeae TaxID=1294199 RepID=UPI000C762366|nr:UDP-glucuronosyltransferase 2C1 isoform X2 [Eurytemora carolleeae]XP_023346394.1 UDP-glucuronosyltransferase 2C1 isoform X2 [Eurytemora carolleeae]|eukprot:XP_023346393.1 UDP-glucuronosyltransferase 2C1-like isoform X2 [Eurytemora affinis]
MKLYLTVFLSIFFRYAKGSNILVLHPLYAGSHELVLRIIGDELVRRGHNVTQVRFLQTNSQNNLDTRVHVITVPIDGKKYPCSRYINEDGEFDIGKNMGPVIWNSADTPYSIPYDLYCVTHVHCKMMLEDKRLLETLNATRFDVAIVDLIANECGLAFARVLGLPVASFWGFGYQGGEVRYTSSWNPASLVPSFMSGLGRNMNFWQRNKNLLYYFGHAVLQYWQASTADVYIKKNYPDLVDSAHLIHDIDLSLVHNNFFVDYPRLIAPNTKYVGGMHIKESKELPIKFKEFVAGSENGVILFSLGYTGFTPRDIPKYVIEAFIFAFSRIKQRVIMRFDRTLLETIPENVMVVDWFPQQDLLAQNQTVLFITHCGHNSVLEAIYYGVPILAMPVFADQPENAEKIKDKGFGLMLNRHSIVKEEVLRSINEIMNNSSYKAKVEQHRAMWKDERFSSFDEAIYWIELLIKYGNFEHLRINDGDLNLVQYLCLDVVLLWIAASLTILTLFFSWIRNLIRSAKLKKD